MIWEKISTKGRNNIKPTGEPYGNIWAKKSFSWVKDTQIIKGTQNKILMVKVTL